jgi:hypothetical protein
MDDLLYLDAGKGLPMTDLAMVIGFIFVFKGGDFGIFSGA